MILEVFGVWELDYLPGSQRIYPAFFRGKTKFAKLLYSFVYSRFISTANHNLLIVSYNISASYKQRSVWKNYRKKSRS